MKRFLLFAGTELAKANGVAGFVADFESSAEALVLLVDQQTPSEWWHILDTQTGEVIERRQIRLSNGAIGFERSDRIVGTPAKMTIASAGAARETLEASSRNVVTSGLGNGHGNGYASGQPPDPERLEPHFA